MDSSDASQQEATRRGLSPAWIATGAIALLVLGLLAYALIARPTESLQVGSPAPDFQLTAFDGTPMDLATQQGNVVVINYFASWCTPCRQEAADLEQTWREYQDGGVQFYGIAYKDAPSRAEAFLEEFEVTYPSAVDPGNHAARAYGVTGVPETFVIDQQGQLVRHFLGAITGEELSQEIESLIGQ